MCDEVCRRNFEAIEHTTQFFGPFWQANRVCACLMAAIQNDTIVLAQCANLARVNEFEMFKDGYKDDRFAISYIDARYTLNA